MPPEDWDARFRDAAFLQELGIDDPDLTRDIAEWVRNHPKEMAEVQADFDLPEIIDRAKRAVKAHEARKARGLDAND